MKHTVLTAFFLLALSASAMATEFTVLPFPRNGTAATTEDWVATMDDLKSVNATGVVITKAWGELEPAKRQYRQMLQLGKDFKFHTEEGRSIFFGFQPINTTRRDMPKDLMDKAWDDPEMIQRFQELVDHFMLEGPKAPKYISLGNEVDVYFGKHPKELDAFLKFFTAASTVIKRNAFPAARIGITVTYEGLTEGRGEMIQKLIDAGDIAIFTYYPVLGLQPQPVENVGEHIESIVKMAGEKDVFLQEVGYPSGSVIGSSPEKQALFFTTVISAIRQHEQIKFANLFLLHDFTPDLCDAFEKYYGFEKAPAEPKKKFRDFLCTLGLKAADGTEKPAWGEVKKALQ